MWLARLFVLLGCLLASLGLVFVVMYVWEAIISRSGEPDQSLIFWYLPILFLGLIAFTGGITLFLAGMSRIRNRQHELR